MLGLVVAYYLGGVTVSLLAEAADDSCTLADVGLAAIWPVAAVSYLYDRIQIWRGV